jgi:hypothetical protein
MCKPNKQGRVIANDDIAAHGGSCADGGDCIVSICTHFDYFVSIVNISDRRNVVAD